MIKQFFPLGACTLASSQLITDVKEKADTLNNQFYSIFTDEDLSDLPGLSVIMIK